MPGCHAPVRIDGETPQIDPVAGFVPRLLAQLALGRGQRCLPFIQITANDGQRLTRYRVLGLSKTKESVLLCNSDDIHVIRRNDPRPVRDYIEIIRGVPLITILFMSIILFPIFLPPGMEILGTWRVLVAVALFSAAYIAENVRGGLQMPSELSLTIRAAARSGGAVSGEVPPPRER